MRDLHCVQCGNESSCQCSRFHASLMHPLSLCGPIPASMHSFCLSQYSEFWLVLPAGLDRDWGYAAKAKLRLSQLADVVVDVHAPILLGYIRFRFVVVEINVHAESVDTMQAMKNIDTTEEATYFYFRAIDVPFVDRRNSCISIQEGDLGVFEANVSSSREIVLGLIDFWGGRSDITRFSCLIGRTIVYCADSIAGAYSTHANCWFDGL